MSVRGLIVVIAVTVAGATASSCGDDDAPAGDAGGARMDAGTYDAALPDAMAPDADCTTCEGCFMCRAPACAAMLAACTAEPDCMAFRTCVGGRDDPAVVASCRSMHAAGAAAFCGYWGCLTYTQCDAVCEDAVICPRP